MALYTELDKLYVAQFDMYHSEVDGTSAKDIRAKDVVWTRKFH